MVITLVNGTFAKDADWVDFDSPLAQYLRAHLGGAPVVEPCRWEGGNSTASRHEGAEELSRRIEDVARRYPGSPHFLVAHSHGGNVAVHALRRSSASVLGLVCLNTPFLHCRRRSFFLLLLLGEYWFTPVMLPAFVILLYMYFTRYHPMYPDQYLWPVLRAVVWAWLWMPIGLLFVGTYARLTEKLKSYLAVVRVRAEAVLVPDLAPTVPMLALTVPGDEAYWWLRLIDTLSVLVRVPLYVAIGSLAIGIVANNLQSVIWLLGWFWAGAREMRPTFAVSTFALALGALGAYVLAQVLVVFVIPVVRGHVLSYGEGRWESVLFSTTVKPYAVGMSPSQVMRIPVRVLLMRHSALYSQQRVAALITNWIRTRMTTPVAHSPTASEPAV